MQLLRYTYKQKDGWSCGPAVVRTVLHAFGIQKPVRQLRKELGTTRAGTDNRGLIKVFRRHNIRFVMKENGKINDIKKHLDNHWVLVTYWIPFYQESHYSIVTKVNQQRIYFHDTWFGGNHSYSLDYFLKNWWDEDASNWFMAIKKPSKLKKLC